MVIPSSIKMLVKTGPRVALPVVVFLGCAWALYPYIAAQSLDSVQGQLEDVSWSAWLCAALFSAISLWSVGRYDGVAHRHFATGVAQDQARWSGTISIAIAQSLGFGLFTGAFVRWRMLPDTTLATSLKLSAFVSFSFLGCWAVVMALACVFLPAPFWIKPLAFTVLAVLPAAVWLMFWNPVLRISRLSIRLPTLRNSFAILIWTTVDTVAAGAALFVLLPNGTDLSFAQFLPVFLLALGAALLSNTPGGVGPFELMMIGLVSQLPVAEILVSILAFRLVYYAIPALLAGLALTKPFRNDHSGRRFVRPPFASLHTARNAELGVMAQNGGRILATRDGACVVWPTGQTLTTLCNPLRGSATAALAAVQHNAKKEGRLPMIYKCSGESAVAARRLAWSVLHISDDAILTPYTYDLNAPSRRRLRRKLRNAEKSGVEIAWQGPRPWAEMARVDSDWQSRNGTARGGTMGRFQPVYLTDHFIACAYRNGRLCAFASFQRSTQEWCLDVMRHDDTMPDGTMHALVHQAILCAKAAHIPRISLAAVPACPNPQSAFFRWAAQIAVSSAGGTGLRQFKSIFAPQWSPRYAAAPNSVSLVCGLADIAREVHRPPPLIQTRHQEIHNSDENYVLASRRAS